MPRNNPYYLLIAMIALTLLAAPAGATPLLYDTQPGWAAAVSNIITTTFDGQKGEAALKWYNTGGGLTVSGVNFVGFTGDVGSYMMKVYNPSYDPAWDRGSGASLGGGWSPGYIQATLPAGGVTALAFNFATEVVNHNVTISLSSGESYTLTSPANSTMNFFGLTSTTPITSVQISANGGTSLMIDNFSSGELPAEETSEPAAILLGATGLAGIWLARRLRRYPEAKAAA